jgi:branched-chain amino acid transport system substrate-binding protein
MRQISGRNLLISALCCGMALCAACSRSDSPSACNDALGCVELDPGAPITIGVIQALTGSIANLGQEQLRGLELALAKRDGRILGHKVELVIEDTSCCAEGGANAALRITSDPKVVAIFGTTCSGDAATASKVMSEAGFTMISGNNSAPSLTAIGGQRGPDWRAGYFRTAPNEEASGPAAATFAYQVLGIHRAAVINDGDLYTRSLAQGFAKRFKQLGGVVSLEATVSKQDTDMRPVLEAIKESRAKMIFFPLFQPEGNYLIMQARRDPALRDIVLMSDGALIEQSFINAVGQTAKGVYFVGPTPPRPSPELEQLQASYRKHFKSAPSTYYYVSAYDAADLLFSALENTAEKLPDGRLRLGRQALRDALYSTRERQGLTGTLSCNEFGDCAQPSFNILRLDDPEDGVEGLKANVQFTYKPKP